MLINKNNLAIAALCAKDVVKGFSTNVLRVTNKATTATNNAYAVSVSTLGGIEGPETYLDPKAALQAKAGLSDIPVEISTLKIEQIATNRYPNIEKLFTDATPAFELILDNNYLLTLAKSIADFQGGVVRIRFFGANEAVRLDARNAQGQKWEALLMPRMAEVDAKRFAEPEPAAVPPPPPVEESEFDKALRLAGSL